MILTLLKMRLNNSYLSHKVVNQPEKHELVGNIWKKEIVHNHNLVAELLHYIHDL